MDGFNDAMFNRNSSSVISENRKHFGIWSVQSITFSVGVVRVQVTQSKTTKIFNMPRFDNNYTWCKNEAKIKQTKQTSSVWKLC